MTKAFADTPADTGISGDNLVELFTSQEPGRMTFAFGYVIGIAEAFNGLGTPRGAPEEDGERWFCLPAYATPQRTVEAVRRYFEENPELRGQLASRLVVAALRKAYPCD
jgi:hypothetical protein